MYFLVKLHLKDINVLEFICSTLGLGSIYKNSGKYPSLTRNNIKNMAIIIEFFDKYPLISQKLGEEVYGLILNKQHLTLKGGKSVVATRGSTN